MVYFPELAFFGFVLNPEVYFRVFLGLFAQWRLRRVLEITYDAISIAVAIAITEIAIIIMIVIIVIAIIIIQII